MKIMIRWILLLGLFGVSSLGAQIVDEAFKKKVDQLVQNNNLEQAIQMVKERLLLEKEPTTIAQLNGIMADLLYRKLDIKEAGFYIDLYLKAFPEDMWGCFLKGKILQSVPNQQKESIVWLKKSEENGNQSTELFASMGFSYRVLASFEKNEDLKQKFFHKALDCYGKALEQNPDYIPAWGNMGDIFFNLGNYAKATLAYQQIVERIPKNLQAYVKLAHCYIQSQKFKEAMEILKKAETKISEQPIPKQPQLKYSFLITRASIYLYMVEVLLAQHQVEEAKPILKKLIEFTTLKPGEPEIAQITIWNKKARDTLRKLEEGK